MTARDLFQLPEEHRALREVVRSLAETKVAPHAADVDEAGHFPMEAYDALVAGDLHAPHVPEAFGGVGADALAFSIAVEATVAWISSLGRVPTGVNSLRLHSNPPNGLDAHAAESLAQEQVSQPPERIPARQSSCVRAVYESLHHRRSQRAAFWHVKT